MKEAMVRRIYRIAQVAGSSDVSWEDAIGQALASVDGQSDHVRVGKVLHLEVTLRDGIVGSYGARLNLYFWNDSEED